MKVLGVLALVLVTTTGCPTMGTMQSNASSSPNAFPTPAQQSFFHRQLGAGFPSQPAPMGPQMVMPATGGAPVLGTPLGGNLYLPATGGPPIIGTH